MPKTKPGKASLALIILMPILFIYGGSLSGSLYNNIPAGNTIPEDIKLRPVLALTMLSGMLSGAVSFFTGFYAIKVKKERSLSVLISTSIGAILLIFILGEFLFPH